MINRNFFSSEKSRVIVSDRFIPVRNPEGAQRDTLKFLLQSAEKTNSSLVDSSQQKNSSLTDSSCVHRNEQPSVSDLLIRDYLHMSGQKLFTFSKTPKQQRLSKVYQGLSGKSWMPSGAEPGCSCRLGTFATASKVGCGSLSCRFAEKLTNNQHIKARDLPLKILDAPGMTDDFYLDVLDWAKDGTIALGIEDKVFVYKFPEGGTKELVDLQKLSRQWIQEEVIQEETEESPRQSCGGDAQGNEAQEVPEFCLNTPVKTRPSVDKIKTKETLQEETSSQEDVLYLSFEDSEFSNDNESEQMSPIELPKSPSKKKISFKVENFANGFLTPKKKQTRTFSIFEKEEKKETKKRMDSLEGLEQLNFDELLQEEQEPVVKKRLFQDDQMVPQFTLQSEEEIVDEESSTESQFSLSFEEEKEDSIQSEESEFEENYEMKNPFLRCPSTNFPLPNRLLFEEEPPQLRSPCSTSPNNFLLSQVNMIVDQNFLESPSPDPSIPPRPSGSFVHAPRLSSRESLVQGKNQVIVTKFNSNGKLLSVVDAKGLVYILDVNTGQVVHKRYFANKISALNWSGDRVLAMGDSSGQLFLFSTERGLSSPLLKIQMHHSEIIKIAFSENGTYLATSGADKQILGLDLGRLRHHFYSLRGSFLQNLPELASISEADIINLTTLPSMSKALVFHPLNPRYLVVGGGVDDQKIRLFDIVSKRLLFKVHSGSQVCSLGFDSEGKILISSHGFSENVIKLWDLNLLMKKLTKLKVLTGHAERVLHLAVSPCGKYIVSGSGDETLRIWECFSERIISRKGKMSNGNFMKRGISSMR